jgi:hypothetical protein
VSEDLIIEIFDMFAPNILSRPVISSTRYSEYLSTDRTLDGNTARVEVLYDSTLLSCNNIETWCPAELSMDATLKTLSAMCVRFMYVNGIIKCSFSSRLESFIRSFEVPI